MEWCRELFEDLFSRRRRRQWMVREVFVVSQCSNMSRSGSFSTLLTFLFGYFLHLLRDIRGRSLQEDRDNYGPEKKGAQSVHCGEMRGGDPHLKDCTDESQARVRWSINCDISSILLFGHLASGYFGCNWMLSRSNVRYLNTLCRMREFELGIHGLHFAVLFLWYSTTFVQYYICFMHAYFDFDYRKVSKSPPRNPQICQPAVPRKLKKEDSRHTHVRTQTHVQSRTKTLQNSWTHHEKVLHFRGK